MYQAYRTDELLSKDCNRIYIDSFLFLDNAVIDIKHIIYIGIVDT